MIGYFYVEPLKESYAVWWRESDFSDRVYIADFKRQGDADFFIKATQHYSQAIIALKDVREIVEQNLMGVTKQALLSAIGPALKRAES